MKTSSRGNWQASQIARMKKIKRNNNTRESLKALAVEWNVNYHKLYTKWDYENRKINGELPFQKDKAHASGVSRASNGTLEPMQFTIDTTVTTPKRSDPEDVVRMKMGLQTVIPQLQPNKGSIIIPAKLSSSAKKFLGDEWPKNVFTVVRQRHAGKETGFSRIFKRR